MMLAIKRVGHQWFNRWLTKRVPKQKMHRLGHRNIFIFPSKTGLVFLLLITTLWLLGTNYQNNLVMSVAFLLLALMIVCILHTYANLSGLQINVVNTQAGFVDGVGRVELLIKRNANRYCETVNFRWKKEDDPVAVSLIDKTQETIHLPVTIEKRGWYQPGRLRIHTTFPLGIIVAWSYLEVDAPILAYPKPIDSGLEPSQQILGDTDDLEARPSPDGHEEFAGLREYQSGDSLRHIAWRSLARGQGLASKYYEDYANEYLWLDWEQLAGLSREARLSRLCGAVLSLAKSQSTIHYGLRLPGVEVAPSCGEAHQQLLLEALALFEWDRV